MATPTLAADYFDGRSARSQPVRLWLEHDQAVIAGLSGEHRYPIRQVRWPERTRYGQRRALLPDGGVVSVADPASWDQWALAATGGRGLGGSLAQRWYSSWRLTLVALFTLVVVIVALWRFGLPLAADVIVRRLPTTLDEQLGQQAMEHLRGLLLKPSTLSPQAQEAWRSRFAAMAAAQPVPPPPYELRFQSAEALGPNAFALPGGQIIVTDQLIALLEDQPDAVLGVLAHEMGHVQARHGMRMLARATAGSAFAALLVGDTTGLLASAPAALVVADYSRDFEREADATARQWLMASGRSPRAMRIFFERMQARRGEQRLALPIAFSSHPADDERIRFFSD